MAFGRNSTKASVSTDVARAQDPGVTGAELVELAAHRAPQVKEAVAARPECPMASMFSLAQEEDPRILHALLGNPNVPKGLVIHLAQNRRTAVRDQALAWIAAHEAEG